ncbi:MAG: alpha/beta hydrolase [SAR324 cluster bacterium]|nr:alpha/beta hydrolase [SAR324 cluster bacterium]
MPKALINGVNLYYEETGTGTPVVFVHEFAGDYRSWEPQVRYFSRRYRCITYNARGFPPSDVPESHTDYSQEHAVGDLLGLLDHLGLDQAHIVGFSMGGFCSLIFGLKHPQRALSLVVAGCGYGSDADRSRYVRDVEEIAAKMIGEGMEVVAKFYARGPTRVQFIDTDPRGWREFYDQLSASSGLGHGNTMLGVQKNRATVPQLTGEMKKLTVPTLIMTGDEDEPCLEPGLLMKRTIPSAALVVMPKCGHAINLEAPDAFNGHLAEFFAQVDAGRWTLRNPQSLSKSSMLPPDQDHD